MLCYKASEPKLVASELSSTCRLVAVVRMRYLHARIWGWTLLVLVALGVGTYFRNELQRHTTRLLINSASHAPGCGGYADDRRRRRVT